MFLFNFNCRNMDNEKPRFARLYGIARRYQQGPAACATLHGYTLGLGTSLAIHCDFRIPRHDTRFSFPEVQHGILSPFSAIPLPSLIGEARALSTPTRLWPSDWSIRWRRMPSRIAGDGRQAGIPRQ
ncbi:hypothetical protein [Brenneria populi]|uniref:hypothetical protein n=1 Tax=Brenneria populi TaxID=1505588 RepID=UPI002E17C7B0